VTRPSLLGIPLSGLDRVSIRLAAMRRSSDDLGVSGANTSTAPDRRLRNRIPNVNHRRAGGRDQLERDTVSAMNDFERVQLIGEGAGGLAWADAAHPSNWRDNGAGRCGGPQPVTLVVLKTPISGVRCRAAVGAFFARQTAEL
jgi:hypothetical protein